MKQLVLLTLALVAVTEGFVIDPFGYGGGFGGLGGLGGFGLGSFGYGGLFPSTFHHHTVQPIVQPIIIQPPKEEEPEPEPKVEVHVHHGPAEPHPPEPHPHPPEPPQVHVIHV
ncbi:hypothetical protein FJT64_000973 [Amphibalanus amphitrite]|uniref:Uncharacterized protein n=1 Tax=Amphibalanus amphitrite TaxID=1232801 RepID=A0A6A4VNQ5_AMPAM|nr:keratin, type II cytoskeletal 2 epidermal-like [Amphibalanus amphitrite]KAF0293040.1 hypothetical protein FJT64_000973 [Amphibalanus amphitrite]